MSTKLLKKNIPRHYHHKLEMVEVRYMYKNFLLLHRINLQFLNTLYIINPLLLHLYNLNHKKQKITHYIFH